MSVQRLSALVLYSSAPERLAGFYREVLGIPVEAAEHGAVGPHFEAFFAGTQFAIHQKVADYEPLIPTFRVPNIQAFGEELAKRGVVVEHPVLDIGEGKKVVTFFDPDGHRLRAIELS